MTDPSAHANAQALSVAMAEYPLLNSSLSAGGDSLVQHSAHNIGVAMATPTGLVVGPALLAEQLGTRM